MKLFAPIIALLLATVLLAGGIFAYARFHVSPASTASLHLASPSPIQPSPLPSASPTPFVCVEPDGDLPRTRLSPCLVSVTPMGKNLDQHTPIAFSFSQPMVPSSVSVTFAPSALGLAAWTDPYTLVFQPFLLAHATTYKITLQGHAYTNLTLKGPAFWTFTTIPGPPLVLKPGPTTVRIPVLMYHYVRVVTDKRDILGFNLSVTPANFAAQMDWLATHGFHPITLDDLAGYLNGHQALPAHPIVLTFDDGYADFYTNALPVLLSHDFPAVSYIVPGFWGDASRYMTPDQVLRINQEGIQVGSHTMNHVNLINTSNSQLPYQLTQSKAELEKLLSHPVLSFCYPSGDFNSRVAQAVQAAGYRDATTTQYGRDRALYSRYIWGRLRISGGESLATYAANVAAASY